MMRLGFFILILLLVIFLIPVIANSQQVPANATTNPGTKTTVTTAAGSQFEASRSKRFWWGKHWRNEWLTLVAFPILDLNNAVGGLTPLKEGGGKETKSLRLLGANKKEYLLRSIDKNPDVLVPEIYKGSFIQAIVNDQVSIAHPYSAQVVARLSAGIGILHTNPNIVFVPDDARLGIFTSDFAGKLCLFEERPSGTGWKYTNLTGNAADIVNTKKLFEKLTAANNYKVDQKAFLKARLFDMIINDWDRHDDQWLWAADKTSGRICFQPFARDRDQAFSRVDGINMFLITLPWGLRHLQNMNRKITDVIGSMQSGLFIDKKFLNELTIAEWRQSIFDMQQSLTDDIIDSSLHALPTAIYPLSCDFLFKRIRSRRDDLLRAGMRYYHILNRSVDITGSDKDEIFIIKKTEPHLTNITACATVNGKPSADTLYHRVFDDRQTKKIFLYGLGGDDIFSVEGVENNKTLVRGFGNEGKNQFIKIDTFERLKKIWMYDAAANSPISKEQVDFRSIDDTAVTNYHWNEARYDWWMPFLMPGYNPDDGLVIGAGITYKRMQWNKHPFGWQQTFTGNYAASTGAFSLLYNGTFNHTIGKWDLEFLSEYRSPSYVINFYSFGNDTKLITHTKSFYRIRARNLLVNPAISRNWHQSRFAIGLILNTVKVMPADNKIISQPIDGIDTSVFKTKYYTGANASWSFNSTDSIRYPTRGIKFQTDTRYIINLGNDKRDYIHMDASASFYYSPLEAVTIANRMGISLNKGEYQFYQANTLGGTENLRGYWRSRFTGKGCFFQNTEVRIKIAALKGYVFRGTLGLYGFFDDGRVWVDNDHSNRLHTGYGGGAYFLPFNALAINLFYACSSEVNTFTIRTGFFF